MTIEPGSLITSSARSRWVHPSILVSEERSYRWVNNERWPTWYGEACPAIAVALVSDVYYEDLADGEIPEETRNPVVYVLTPSVMGWIYTDSLRVEVTDD